MNPGLWLMAYACTGAVTGAWLLQPVREWHPNKEARFWTLVAATAFWPMALSWRLGTYARHRGQLRLEARERRDRLRDLEERRLAATVLALEKSGELPPTEV